MWSGRRAATGCTLASVIVASHIVPHRDSNEPERGDPHNGIPLIANLDKLFDCGLVTFGDDGQIVISSHLDAEVANLLGARPTLCLRQPLSCETRAYLHRHRNRYFRE